MSGVSNVATAFRKLGGSTDVRRIMTLPLQRGDGLQINGGRRGTVERALQALEAAAIGRSIHSKRRSPTHFTSNLEK